MPNHAQSGPRNGPKTLSVMDSKSSFGINFLENPKIYLPAGLAATLLPAFFEKIGEKVGTLSRNFSGVI
jgi:hypothetical protein